MGKIMNFMKSKNKYIIATLMLFLMFFAGTALGGVESRAAGSKENLTIENNKGTVVKDKNGVLYYKSSYKRVTGYYPYQTSWTTEQKQNAMVNFLPNQGKATGNQMATSGFRYQDKNENINNNIKMYTHRSFETMNLVYSPGDMLLTDGTRVEFRYLGYTNDGYIMSNSFFLNDTVKDASFNDSSYLTKTIAGTDVQYKVPNQDMDAVGANIDLLSANVGNDVVLDGIKTTNNKNLAKAEKTFNAWFNGTIIGRNYLNYAIANKGRTAENAWAYWNEYLEIDGDIDEGSVFLYLTRKGGMNYRDYVVPSEAGRNMVSHTIDIYDISGKHVGKITQNNTQFIYADSISGNSGGFQLAKGGKYTIKCSTKFLVISDESNSETYTKQQSAQLNVYYDGNIASKIASLDNIKVLNNGLASVEATTPEHYGGKTYYTACMNYETTYTVPRHTTAKRGAFDLIIPGIYQENGDNYEMLDDSLVIEFDIISIMDMIMTDYNAIAGRRWKEGDIADKERVWIEDINGNKISEYVRNEPFYICYAYEQYTGEYDIENPSLDATIYRAQSAKTQHGTEVFNGRLTTYKTISPEDDPTIYRQLCFVEYKPTQDDSTYIPDGALIIENTPFLNVYAMISTKHTEEERNNVWVASQDTCAGALGVCVMFPAKAADMTINKVIFTDENGLEIKQDITSVTNQMDEGDTIGYYDREESVRVDYELDQVVYANINIPRPSVTRTIYQGVKNADGTISKYLDEDGKPVVLVGTGTVQSPKTLWYEDQGNGEDIVLVTDYIPATTAEAIYIEYGVADKHYLQRENYIDDSYGYMEEKFVATLSCTTADMQMEKEIYLYDSKGNKTMNIPNLGETLTFGFNISHVGNTKEEKMIIGGTIFNPYVTVNVKIINNDKVNGAVTSYDQIPLNSYALIGAGNAVADTLLYPGQSKGWLPTLSVTLPDVQLDVGNVTVCGKIATAHDINKSNTVRDENDEFCQVFKTERDFSITDLSYVPTKSVTADTELGFSVTVKSLGGAYNDKDVVLQPILTVYNYNYNTSQWDSVYRAQINVANGEWVVTEINIPDFHVSDNPAKPTRLRVVVNDKTNPADWKYQEYVLKETIATLNNDPYQNNYKEITITTKQPDLTVCPECTVK